jgi:hypothetical protein
VNFPSACDSALRTSPEPEPKPEPESEPESEPKPATEKLPVKKNLPAESSQIHACHFTHPFPLYIKPPCHALSSSFPAVVLIYKL